MFCVLSDWHFVNLDGDLVQLKRMDHGCNSCEFVSSVFVLYHASFVGACRQCQGHSDIDVSILWRFMCCCSYIAVIAAACATSAATTVVRAAIVVVCGRVAWQRLW